MAHEPDPRPQWMRDRNPSAHWNLMNCDEREQVRETVRRYPSVSSYDTAIGVPTRFGMVNGGRLRIDTENGGSFDLVLTYDEVRTEHTLKVTAVEGFEPGRTTEITALAR
ncbi:hypothetical protein [Sphingosinicella sp. BN140058]|uniref:hypothetical protein n=1 Tax=Sphingosinicella sp. BN140058 TaxID=1892855 RepID=UPI0010132D32|nr:hypothetical protein [Sphingosinicella sp. BN140058]QAY80476.1 hypothetical protein ETR14_27955 [Sphingosinicella sp. BN140058]